MTGSANERCGELEGVAPDLALGLLAGAERSDALTHLDGCADCRKVVDELAQVADTMLLLAPGAEPSEGFEGRVLERLGHQRSAALASRQASTTKAQRARRRVLGWAAVAVCVAGIAGAFLLGRGSSAEPEELAIANMTTRRGNVVGEAYVHDGESDWLFVAVPEWSKWWSVDDVRYTVEVGFVEGGKRVFPNLDLADGAWGTRLDVDGHDVRRVAILNVDGRVLCEATIETA